MTPEAAISRFLQEAFTDDSLAVLRADAARGNVPYLDCHRCLVGHARSMLISWPLHPSDEDIAVSMAYLKLYPNEWLSVRGDMERQARLIPLIDAEIARRSAARAEVVAKAREVVTPASAQSPAGTLSASLWRP